MARQIARAAKVLGYSPADWFSMSSKEKRDIRNSVRNADRRVQRYAARSKENRIGENRPEDWETWEWEAYREQMGL